MADYKKYSLEGAKLIGKGGTGECYQIDEDKILKLYYEGFSEDWILKEKQCAKMAMISMIPTAISYEIAEVNGRKGIVFEMIDALTLSQCIRKNPQNLETYAIQYADLAKTIHSTNGDLSLFGRGTDSLRDPLVSVDYLSKQGMQKIETILTYLDQVNTYIHGDFNPNNVLVCNGEFFLIDMGGFSIGSPVIDLATLYFGLFCSPEALWDGPNTFTGMTKQQHQLLWDAFIVHYYNVSSYEEAKKNSKEASMIEDVALLIEMRFVQLFGKYFPITYSENTIKRAVERFENHEQVIQK